MVRVRLIADGGMRGRGAVLAGVRRVVLDMREVGRYLRRARCVVV